MHFCLYHILSILIFQVNLSIVISRWSLFLVKRTPVFNNLKCIYLLSWTKRIIEDYVILEEICNGTQCSYLGNLDVWYNSCTYFFVCEVHESLTWVMISTKEWINCFHFHFELVEILLNVWIELTFYAWVLQHLCYHWTWTNQKTVASFNLTAHIRPI